MFLEFGNHLCRNNSSFHCVFTSEHFLIFYSKSMKTKIVTVHCRKSSDKNRMCGYKRKPRCVSDFLCTHRGFLRLYGLIYSHSSRWKSSVFLIFSKALLYVRSEALSDLRLAEWEISSKVMGFMGLYSISPFISTAFLTDQQVSQKPRCLATVRCSR